MERWGVLDESLHYCMDYEYWLRLGLGGAQFMFAPQVLAGSRFYAATKTLGARVKVHAEINSMLRDRLGKTPARWLFNYAHILADSFGIRRTSRVLHVCAIAALSIYAALRWNRSLSSNMAQVLRRDMHHALRSVWSK